MLEKYLNKNVVVAEKYYNGASTLDGFLNNGSLNKIVGVLTKFDENFIELDNTIILNIQHIYMIKLAD